MSISVTPSASSNREYASASVALSVGGFPGDGLVTTSAAPVSFPLVATGGTAPYFFTVVGGRLPAGLRLDAGGSIAGQPQEVGTAMVTIRISDSASPRNFADFDFQLTVN